MDAVKLEGAFGRFFLGCLEASSERAAPVHPPARRLRLRCGAPCAVAAGGSPARVEAARAIVEAGVAVMGHVGLTPQSVSVLGERRPLVYARPRSAEKQSLARVRTLTLRSTTAASVAAPCRAGGFRPQAQVADEALAVMAQAQALQKAGCFALVLECVPAPIAAAVTASVDIPTIGIGAGAATSGQVRRHTHTYTRGGDAVASTRPAVQGATRGSRVFVRRGAWLHRVLDRAGAGVPRLAGHDVAPAPRQGHAQVLQAVCARRQHHPGERRPAAFAVRALCVVGWATLRCAPRNGWCCCPQAALQEYRDEVVSGGFPSARFSPYRIPQQELGVLVDALRRQGAHAAAQAVEKAAHRESQGAATTQQPAAPPPPAAAPATAAAAAATPNGSVGSAAAVATAHGA